MIDSTDHVLRVAEAHSTLVVRSDAPAVSTYTEYKQLLRYDFLHSCAYCTMTEAEAQAIRFTIDHYEPKSAHPELTNQYSNLMYCCDECNRRKGDLVPPESARASGIRYFRPDTDEYDAHFDLMGRLLRPKTDIGDFSIEAINLNRHGLRRLRELRERLFNCQEFVAKGIFALRRTSIDRLPRELKGKVLLAITDATALAATLADEIDKLLREFAKSELIDPDPESEIHAKQRVEKLKNLQGLHPGNWRGRKR